MHLIVAVGLRQSVLTMGGILVCLAGTLGSLAVEASAVFPQRILETQ